MKTATLMMCLIAGLTTSGCVIHHNETVSPRHEQHDERARPEGVAVAPSSDKAKAR